MRVVLANFLRVLFAKLPDEGEILRRIDEEMERPPTLVRAARWARDLESLEPYFLMRERRTPPQIRMLVEAKGAVYDLVSALESGSEPPYAAYYHQPLKELRRDLDRQPFFGF